ncbi:imm11 family protein [Hahella sp. HN01]|uniref:imm11 family protein n=1 Tax=Hahella sp. HN01 TaxID=2847262 RepID=UPI001C1EDFEF|nr:DUF1629 domain-containing protein [Hahella sp. HN01]MBU6953554.1 hypothetical protein [Hahella sp. HN01]
MLQDEYYVIERENNDDYPLFSWDQESGPYGGGKAVNSPAPVHLALGEPISASFKWVDYHALPSPVVSEPLAEILAGLNIYGVELVPALVRNPKDFDEPVKKYCLVHIWNRIACLDKTKSVIRTNKAGTRIFSIDQMVLDESVLKDIEEDKRLVFELDEKAAIFLVHQKVKDAILSISPKGCRFFKASDWNSSSSFD